jgi:hypothetical protein
VAARKTDLAREDRRRATLPSGRRRRSHRSRAFAYPDLGRPVVLANTDPVAITYKVLLDRDRAVALMLREL